MSAQKAHPAESGIQTLCAKKVFVPERRILPDGYTIGVQLRARQNPCVETDDFHLPSEGPFQMCYQVGVHAASPRQVRHAGLQGDHEHDRRQRWLPPLLQPGHLARKFRRLIGKKVGARLDSEPNEKTSGNRGVDRWSES